MAKTALSDITEKDMFCDYDHLEKTMLPWNSGSGIKKLVMKEGYGAEIPALSVKVSMMYVHYIAICENSKEPFKSTLSLGRPQRFLMDRNHTELVPCIFDSFMSMRIGEVSKFLLLPACGFTDNWERAPRLLLFAELVYMIPLLENPSYTKLSSEERSKIGFSIVCQETIALADKGDILHKQSKFESALKLFEIGVTLLEDYRAEDLEEKEIGKRNRLLFALYRNCAQCFLDFRKWELCCEACQKALDLPHTDENQLYKVFHRYSIAKYHLKDYKMALELCNKAKQQQPTAKPILDVQKLIYAEIFVDAVEN